jgi:hypothetical protein
MSEVLAFVVMNLFHLLCFASDHDIINSPTLNTIPTTTTIENIT